MIQSARPRESGDPVLYRVNSLARARQTPFGRVAKMDIKKLIACCPGSPLSQGRAEYSVAL